MKEKLSAAIRTLDNAVETLTNIIKESVKKDGSIFFEWDIDKDWDFYEMREVGEDGKIYNEDDNFVGSIDDVSIDELYKIAKVALKEYEPK